MDPGQFAQQIKHILGAAEWSDGCEIFGEPGVSVVAGAPTAPPHAFPWALVSIQAGEFDQEDPELMRQSFGVYVGVRLPGDDLGEHAVIGGALGSNGSGRGLVEVDVEVRRAVGKLTGADGCPVTLSAASASSTALLEDNTLLAMSELTVEAACTSLPSYASPQRLRDDSGTWRWEGAHCEARFDFVEYLLVDTPSDPAADPADGDVVYQGTATSSTVSVSGTATILAAYGSRLVTEGYSRPIRGAFV